MNWPIIGKQKTSPLKLSLYESIHLVRKSDWSEIVKDRNFFLTMPYLQSIEEALTIEGYSFRYMMFYDQQYKVAGVAYIQILPFNYNNAEKSNQICGVKHKIRKEIISSLENDVLLCGNAFTTGENGFLFREDINSKDAYKCLTTGLYRLRRAEKVNSDISLSLLKEFWPKSNGAETFTDLDYSSFEIDVNMILYLDQSWEDMDDYLQSMTSKFRTKMKSISKKSDRLAIKTLDLEGVKSCVKDLERLYHTVMDNADFSLGQINGQYFVSLKENLGERFCVKAYFIEDKMVGFNTSFIDDAFVEANYVGIDYAYNEDYAIYQRMLLEYVRTALFHKVKELRYGRTAELMKSNFGAIPVAMKLFVKHSNILVNPFLNSILENIKPNTFEMRRPFKQVLA